MNTKLLMPTLIGLTLSIGTVQAFADSGWHYDEDSDSTIFSYSGSPVTQSTSHSEDGAMQQSGNWYYNESSYNIVYSVEDSRNPSVQTNSSANAIGFDSNLAFLDQ